MKKKDDSASYFNKEQNYQPYNIGFDDYKKNFNNYSALSQTKNDVPAYIPPSSTYMPSYTQIKKVDDDPFFRPKPKSTFKAEDFGVNKVSESINTNKDDSKGTIYRQFTDTKILDVMPDMQRMQTNMIRQRFKGVHRRDLFKR